MKITKPKPTIPVPYESLMGKPIEVPILEDETMKQVQAALAPFTCKIRWDKWGMKKLKAQGGAVLLWGLPGTGKTTVGRWLAKKIGTGFISLTMADIGGGDPGDTEKNARAIFDYGREHNFPVIFMDECDGILWSRDKAGPDSMWMLAVVNEILMQIEKYEGLVILATNLKHVLDPALRRRISEEIHLASPCFEVRLKLWKKKVPSEFPLQPSDDQFTKLARIKLTGATIENAIIAEARVALVAGRNPKFESLCNIAKSYEDQAPN